MLHTLSLLQTTVPATEDHVVRYLYVTIVPGAEISGMLLANYMCVCLSVARGGMACGCIGHPIRRRSRTCRTGYKRSTRSSTNPRRTWNGRCSLYVCTYDYHMVEGFREPSDWFPKKT